MGGLQAEGDTEKDAPENHLDPAHDAVVDPCAQAEEYDSAGNQRNPVKLAHPEMEAVAGEIGKLQATMTRTAPGANP